MVDFGSSRVLLGAAQVGGGSQKRKSSNKSEYKGINMNKFRYMRPFFGGDEWKCGQCELVKTVPNPVVVQPVQQQPQVIPKLQQQLPVVSQPQQVDSSAAQNLINSIMQPVATPATMVGGAKQMSVAQYKKYLEALTTERLHKIASGKGVKITKKKDGKTVYVKKATIVKKLCEFKHPNRR